MTYKAGPGTPNAQNYRELAAISTPWVWRDGAPLVSFNGAIIMLGGWNNDFPLAFDPSYVTNEIWSLDPATTIWTRLLINDPAPSNRWTPRHTPPTFVHNNAIFVIGSDIYNGNGLGTSDVWRGSTPTNWTLRTDTAAWGPRVFHVGASFQNKLWCGLGQADSSFLTAKTDWWGSADEGATWQQYPDFPGAARGLIYNPFEFNGELILIAGGTFDTVGANRSYYNDIFAWNGTSWRTVLANGVAPFIGREYHRTLVVNGAACIINGFGPTGGGSNIQDFWWSDNLIDWQTRPVLWPNSHADGICVHNGDLWMGPGNHGQQKAWRVQIF